MDQQQLITLLVGLLGLAAGAVVGGGSAIIIYGRAIKSILSSPVIMTSLESLASSWPAPIREAVKDTGEFLKEVADDKPGGQPTTTDATYTTTSAAVEARSAEAIPGDKQLPADLVAQGSA